MLISYLVFVLNFSNVFGLFCKKVKISILEVLQFKNMCYVLKSFNIGTFLPKKLDFLSCRILSQRSVKKFAQNLIYACKFFKGVRKFACFMTFVHKWACQLWNFETWKNRLFGTYRLTLLYCRCGIVYFFIFIY